MTNCTVLFVLVCLGLGCKMLGRLGQTDYFEGDSAKVAAEEVKEKIGKPFNVAEVFIDKDEFRVHAQDPNNPRNLDEYKYIGGFVTGPNPVKLNALTDNLEKSVFPFDEINFAAIPEFTRQAIEEAGIEGGKIYRMTFQRGFAITETGAGSLGNARWHIEIEGTRENVTAAADPQGKLLGVDLSRTSRAADYQVITDSELQKAQNTFKNFRGANAEIEEIVIYEKFLFFRVPNTENPRVQDTFQFGINGLTKQGLQSGTSTKTSDRENFSLNDIKLADAAAFVEKAKTRLNMPDAAVTSLSIRRETLSVSSKEFRIIWGVGLKKGVNDGSVYYNNDGSEIRLVKNGKVVSN